MHANLIALAVVALSAGTMAPAAEPAAPGTGKLNPRIAALGENEWVNLNPSRPPNNRRNFSGFCMGEGLLWF